MIRTDFPPAFKHREEAAHHLHHSLVHKLGAVVYHFLHCAFLQELAALKTVLTVVEVDAAVGIAAAVFILSKRHAAALAELGKLTGGQMLLLGREACFVDFKGLRLGIGHEVAGRRANARSGSSEHNLLLALPGRLRR